MTQERAVNLLWTGGWDSTFRCLELLLEKGKPVQPWYLHDEERASAELELAAMRAIGEAVRERSAEADRLLREVRIVPVTSVRADPSVSDLWGPLRLGSQYDWLARFAAQYGIEGLELSIEKRPGRAHGMLWANVERVDSRGGATYRLGPHPDNPSLELFRVFEFPILDRTKADLGAHARKQGWEDIMALTWFCHRPRAGKPCGGCTPCLVALQEGMGGRIPPLRRLRPRLRLLKRSLEKRTKARGAAVPKDN